MDSDDDETFGNVARLSSNNPYRNLGSAETSTGFLTFPARSPSTSRRVKRSRTTYVTQPVQIDEFETAFQQETPRPARRRANSLASSVFSSQFSTYDVQEDAVEYSDTARLTAHMADDNRPPTIDELPEPVHDVVRAATDKTQNRQSINRVATVIRKVSRRVVNVQNNRVPVIDTQPLPTIPSTVEDSGPEEAIPLTPTPSSSASPMPDPQVASERKPGLYLAGKSCGLFGPNSKIRKTLARIILWSWTETIMMLVIALHAAVLLAVGWGSTSTPEPPEQWGQTWDQFVLLAIFIFYTLSVICRIIVYGFIFTPKAPIDPPPLAFMRHSWNRIDFIAVVSYWIDLSLICSGVEIIGNTIRILVFKCLSALILVRLLNITDGNRVILQSLRKAGPLVLTVSSFVLFFFVIFAIVGVQSFQGSFLRRCVWTDPSNSTNIQVTQQYCGGYLEDGVKKPFLSKDGEPGPWAKGFTCPEGLVCQEVENPYGNTISFDNIFASMLIVVIIAGNQSWTDLMYNMMDAEYVIASLYFIVIVIVLNFWLINLFVAVINEMFAKVREDSAQHSAFMSSRAKPVLADEGEGWAFGNKRLVKSNRWRSTLFRDIVRITRPLWVVVVAVDLIVMGLKNNDMTPEELDAIDTAELYFSIAFLVEIILRFLAEWPRWRKFFESRSNRADTFIAVVTCIIRIPPIHDHHTVYAWLTVFQVLRIYRIIVVIPRMRTLSARVLGSVWGLINLMFFIILATLLASIMSYQLFEGLLNDSGDEMRFFSIYNSFAGLYQLFSGENWTDVLYDIMEAGVPTNTVAINALFLVLWFLFSNFVLVNMFIAVLMENFETVEEEKKKRQLEQFVRKTEHIVEEDPIISRWNIYRYFRPHPKGLNVNMPANLVWQAKKDVVRDFMVDDTVMEEVDDERKALLGDMARHQHIQPESRWTKIKSLLKKTTPSVQPLPISSTRKSMTLDSKNPLEQFQTFFDRGNRLGVREQQSLQQILLNSSADPLHAPSNTGMDEAMLHNLEERKALRQEFIAAHPTYDKSLYIFSVNNRIRRWCQLLVPPSRGERFFGAQPSLVASWLFYGFISCSVVVTVILTIYNSPVYQFEHQNDPAHLMIFVHLDWAFTIIFSIEFVIRIIADGFLLAPNAYMLNGWNILDLFVLITMYLSNFNSFASSTGLERAFRAFKALRALRLINMLRPAREMFTAIMVKGLPYIADAACLCICIIIPFALYGQNVFQGLFYGCNDDSSDITNKSMCINEAMLGTDAPMPDDTEIYMPRIWANPYVYSFDSFAKGLLLLVEITSGEGWTDVQAASMSIVGKDQAPQQDASQLAGIFFMLYNLIGSILVIALFLGVVLENFSRRNGTAYLTAEQRRWMDLKKLLSRMRPAKRPKTIPSGGIRKKCFDLVVEKRGRFYKFMTVVIVLNILFLCTESDLDTTTVTIARTYAYLGFLLVYWTEIAIKLLGLGWASFRRNLWNLFDLVAVSGSTITVIAALGSNVQKMSVEAQKLFMTAICFKLVQRSDSLNQLFTIIAASAYQILNVFAVWFVVMTTYAIMFMEIFGLTKYGTQSSTEYVNFRNYANTMISLVRYSSGEGWNTVMHDFAVEYPNCVQADDYLYSDCGSTSWAYFLFISFNIISMYIFVAIFVAVVSDNFSYVYQIASNFSLVNRDEIRKFKKAWADIDRDRTGYIEPKDYIAFWRRLGGVFRTRLYDPEFSYKTLTSQCLINEKGPTVMTDPYEVRIDINILNRKLAVLDKATIHQRKTDLNMLFWEAALIEGPKGVSFNQMLLLIARRKLIIPENALLLEELLSTRKREEAVQTLIKIDRVKGMIETIALRKAFLRHLESKRLRKSIPNVPSIVVDQKRLSRPLNLMDLYSAPATPVTPLVGERGFFTEDRDSMSPTSPDVSLAEETTVNTKIWQDLLQKESRL